MNEDDKKNAPTQHDSRSVENRTYGVDWRTCTNCGVTDPTVSKIPPHVHPNVTVCMAVVTKTALGSSSLKESAQPFVRYDLDESEQSALAEAVRLWQERQAEEKAREEERKRQELNDPT